MQYPDKIYTINNEVESQFKEKGSLFIGQVFPIKQALDAEKILSDIRKKYYDATHNCYAYKLLDEEEIKYSDDGEPNGTAGIRILNAIHHFQLSNVLIISTRYYGGTKLGVGPLGKAYYNSALSAIENSKILKKEKYSEILIKFKYDMTSHVHHFLNTYNAKNIQNLFEDSPIIKCLIKPILIEKLSTELTSVSKGATKISIQTENVYI